MLTASGVETSTCQTKWLRDSLNQAEGLLAQITAGTLAADPCWTPLLTADIAAYRTELAGR